MKTMPFVWGTYRAVADYQRVYDLLRDGSIVGIDTAPNYQNGLAERALGTIHLDASTKIFGKVGYTSGDSPSLRKLSNNQRHCLSSTYVRNRMSESVAQTFPTGGQFECISLHNVEHLWDSHPHEEAVEALKQALEALAAGVTAGLTRSIGLSTWTISPASPLGRTIFETIGTLNLGTSFRYFMHPANILRRDIAQEGLGPWDTNKVSFIASAPLAAGAGPRLLGPPFKEYFGGETDSLVQCLMLARSHGLLPCVGVGSEEHARRLALVPDRQALSATVLQSLLHLLENDD